MSNPVKIRFDLFYSNGALIFTVSRFSIEPGLFECTGWYANTQAQHPQLTMPRFLTEKELLDNKYPIEKTYREQMNLLELSQFESELEFYQRSHAVTAAILQMHEAELIGEDSSYSHRHILFVGRVLYFPIKIQGDQEICLSFFSSCSILRNLYASVIWRQISSTSLGTCHSGCRFPHCKCGWTNAPLHSIRLDDGDREDGSDV